mmetsp:Transcript_16391/g.43080  ORF Transcript_16391/g.43080 Transcript_16391/m.43080 type:complete len:266 (-) Transcript_16391:468-1265(-)
MAAVWGHLLPRRHPCVHGFFRVFRVPFVATRTSLRCDDRGDSRSHGWTVLWCPRTGPLRRLCCRRHGHRRCDGRQHLRSAQQLKLRHGGGGAVYDGPNVPGVCGGARWNRACLAGHLRARGPGVSQLPAATAGVHPNVPHVRLHGRMLLFAHADLSQGAIDGSTTGCRVWRVQPKHGDDSPHHSCSRHGHLCCFSDLPHQRHNEQRQSDHRCAIILVAHDHPDDCGLFHFLRRFQNDGRAEHHQFRCRGWSGWGRHHTAVSTTGL